MGYHRTKKNKTYIIKPDNSCQGKGIMLTKTPKVDIKHCDNFVVQQYLSKVGPDTESSNHLKTLPKFVQEYNMISFSLILTEFSLSHFWLITSSLICESMFWWRHVTR